MKKNVLTICCLCFCILCNSQELKNVLPTLTPVSPEASSLAKYINYPVDYSTGLTQISIPLYEIRVGDMVLPVSISYHASGIKVNESSGYVGLGWTLNAEPSISCSTQGSYDLSTYIKNSAGHTRDYCYLENIEKGALDEVPDAFYYKLLDKGGTFYFKKDVTSQTPYEILTYPYEPVRIQLKEQPDYYFEITDENGIYYRFGRSLKGRVATENNSQSLTSAWKGTEIISSRTNDTISFTYYPTPERFEYSLNLYDRYMLEDSVSTSNIMTPNSCLSTVYNAITVPFATQTINDVVTPFKTVPVWDDASQSYVVGGYTLEAFSCPNPPVPTIVRDYVREIKLREIVFKNGKILFESTDGKNLNSIKIYNQTELIRQINFYKGLYSYSDGKSRTHLDSLHILDKEGNVMERYAFTYNPIIQDEYFSNKVDHWGYYNGVYYSSGKSTLPEFPISNQLYARYVHKPNDQVFHFPVSFPCTSKDPSETYMQAGILTSITYPTGGKTEFFYEAHKYMEKDYIGNDRLQIVGGLRIDSIVDSDPVTGKKMIRVLKYGKNENGAGILKHKPSPDDYVMVQENCYKLVVDVITRLRTVYSNSLADPFYSNGSPVVYDYVTEYRKDCSGQNPVDLGKTVYIYNFSLSAVNSLSRVPGTTLFQGYKMDWMYGDLLAKEEYKNNQGMYQLIAKTNYSYSTFNYNTILANQLYRIRNYIGVPPGVGCVQKPIFYYSEYQTCTYEINTGCKKLRQEKTTMIDENNREIVSTVDYIYSNPVLLKPTGIRKINSNGEVELQTYKFVHDTVFSGSKENIRQQFLLAWRINTMYEEKLMNDGSAIVNSADYDLFYSRPMLTQLSTQKNNFPMETRIKYHEYDRFGNPVYITQDDSIHLIYIWAYKGSYPVAEIQNASYEKVCSFLGRDLQSFSEEYVPDLSPIEAMYAHFPDWSITTFTYKPLVGLESVTDSRRLKKVFEYDSFNRLKRIKDQNNEVIETYDYHYQNQ